MFAFILISNSVSYICSQSIYVENSQYPNYYNTFLNPGEAVCLVHNNLARVALVMQEWEYGSLIYDNNGVLSTSYSSSSTGGYFTGINNNGVFVLSVSTSSTLRFSTSVLNQSCNHMVISNLQYDTFTIDLYGTITYSPDFAMMASDSYCYINHNTQSQKYQMYIDTDYGYDYLSVYSNSYSKREYSGRQSINLQSSSKSPYYFSFDTMMNCQSSYVGIIISNSYSSTYYGTRGSFTNVSDHSPIGYASSNTFNIPTHTPTSDSSYHYSSGGGSGGSFFVLYFTIGAVLLTINIIILCIYPNRMFHIGLGSCCCCCCCNDDIERYRSYYYDHPKDFCCCCCGYGSHYHSRRSTIHVSGGGNPAEAGCVLFIFLLIFLILLFPIMMTYILIALLITDDDEREMEKSNFRGKQHHQNDNHHNSTNKSLVPDVPSYSPAAPNMYGQAMPQAPYPSPQYGVPMSPQPYQQYPVPNGPYPPPNVQYQIPNAQYPNAPPQYQVGPTNQPNQIAPPL